MLIGLSHLAQALSGEPTVDPASLFGRFFPPPSGAAGRDPLGVVKRILVGITRNRGEISLYATAAFLWFSTRLFAGVRTSLNDIFDVSARPAPRRHFLINWVRGKLRDVGMVVATVSLLLANTVLTTALALVARTSAHAGSLIGRVLGELLAFGFSVSLFYVTYRYASLRRLSWRTLLIASSFTALLFEVAKRLFGWYLANFAELEGHIGNPNIGAVVLLVLWVYYTAIVFLLGAVVAETWELRTLQQRQRARVV